MLISATATAQTQQANNAPASVTGQEGSSGNLVPSAPAGATADANKDRTYDVVPEHKPFVTAPSMRPNILNEQALVEAGYGEKREVTEEGYGASYTAPSDLDTLAFLLAPDLLPMPLRHEEFAFSNVLIVHVPTPSEIKMMLPGDALDHADTARYRISQYMGDLTGTAAQRRDRQKSAVLEWSRTAKDMAKNLSANPWQKYQFNRMVQAQLQPYKIGIAGQSKREAELLATQIKPIIEKVGIIMNDMPTHQTKMAWYNVMVQLKDSFELYQQQIGDGDAGVNNLLYPEIKKYPLLPRPAGDPPVSQEQAREIAKAQKTQTALGTVDGEPKQPAVQMQDKNGSNSYGGVIVALMMGLVAVFMLRRNKSKSAGEKSK